MKIEGERAFHAPSKTNLAGGAGLRRSWRAAVRQRDREHRCEEAAEKSVKNKSVTVESGFYRFFVAFIGFSLLPGPSEHTWN